MNRVVSREGWWLAAAVLLSVPALWAGAPGGGRGGAQPAWIPAGFDDHQNMMDQLGIKKLRPGKNGNPGTGPGFIEESANDMMNTLPEVLTMKDGTKVTTAAQWPARRAEIAEDFEREVYGRIPTNVPKVTWEAGAAVPGNQGGMATVTRTLTGHVDNSGFPAITVNIRASITVPANTTGAVPVMFEFGGVGGGGGFGGGRGPGGGAGGGPSWQQQAITKGWGYGAIDPGSIQADGGGNALRQGIIGLTNKGEPRKPDDWGALRAWQWGVSRLIDGLEQHPEWNADPKRIGIEGVSRYGKAALVAEAFEPRVAVGFVASSGEGGAKLHRHDFGEAVENLTGSGEYHWMAGNFIKYGAADINGKALTAADLPVDSHELVALCAPRPCLISYGTEANGDPKWVDAAGSYRAGILATPVYELLGKKGYGDLKDWIHAPLPPAGTLVGGELAFRQHTQSPGHSAVGNYPAFFEWIGAYIQAPALPAASAPANQ